WIVMKALEKDRNRRYESANGLAKDVQCYLNDEPVQACPPSGWYRCRKFVRRNRRAVMTAALLGALLVLTVGVLVRHAQQTASQRALGDQAVRLALDRVTLQRSELHAALKKPNGVQMMLNSPGRWEFAIKTTQSEVAQAKAAAARAEGRLERELV